VDRAYKVAWQRAKRAERRKARVCVICGGGRDIPTYNCRDCQDRINKTVRDSKWWLTPKGRKKSCATVIAYRQRLRRKVIMGYGGRCNCCGEDEYLFLELDHVNNDGAKERGKNRSTTSMFLLRIIKDGFPDCYQVLCSNCNQGKVLNHGVCPHITKEAAILWEADQSVEGVIQ
jgi:hypothetical protein